MINHVYRLKNPKQIVLDLVEEKIVPDNIIIRPKYLSICAADRRYYFGMRSKETLKKKLPMALIHEAVGEIIYDPKGELKKGTTVVMVPNTPFEKDEIIKENYLRSSKFRSSGYDGFMQNIVNIRRDRLVPFKDIDMEVAALLELVSVCINAYKSFDKISHARKNIIGIWGCGSVGFVMALVLKNKLPNSKIIVFGTNENKLKYFSFVDEVVLINDINGNYKIDHAFECVGGSAAGDAVNQMIDIINPEGTISLMGVSENLISLNTRMILEKGIKLVGNSRSSYEDFCDSVKLLVDNPDIQSYLKTIISDLVVVNTIKDINLAFEKDLGNNFKTVMKWSI